MNLDASGPDVVVSAFGCDPPPALRTTLAGAPTRPLWFDLEYLSAEAWVDECHGLVSIKPADGARQVLFCPGFTPRSGGLLRERHALAPRPAPGERIAALQALCGVAADLDERVVTLFCYPQARVAQWLGGLVHGTQPSLVLVPEGVAQEEVERFAGRQQAVCAAPLSRGNLRLARIPFLPQDDYDVLLRTADLNFVRGEDSWIRAHWARRPFIWQPYPQDDGAHRIKLDAFLSRLRQVVCYPRAAVTALRGYPDEGAAVLAATPATPKVFAAAAGAAADMMRVWSGAGDVVAAWQIMETRMTAVADAFELWTTSLLEQCDLATQLTRFAARRL